MSPYTTTFKKAVLRKVLPPENRSVHSVSMELGVGEMTIHRWIAQVKDGSINFEQDEENPSGQRNMTEKLKLIHKNLFFAPIPYLFINSILW